jgi:RNA polymerase sigma-70 factor, ECF subfamily
MKMDPDMVPLINCDKADSPDFDNLVADYYQPLYQFAISLTRDETDACDLTQQTFYIWANKGHQLREKSKVKTWLFTTLYREFLQSRRRQNRFPHIEIESAATDLPTVPPPSVNELDSGYLLAALAQLDELHRAPVALFYLQDYSYNEIAGILEVPVGTVRSRLSRGIRRLHDLLTAVDTKPPR